MGYLYYIIYCAATIKNDSPGGHWRAYSAFSMSLAFYIISTIELLGYVHRANKQAANASLIIIGLSYLLSRLYFYSDNRKCKITAYYNEKIGNWKRINAVLCFVWVVAGVGLVYFSTVRLR